jgi:cation:H+ antiporter
MPAAIVPWLNFAACAALIGAAGAALTHYGDLIARLTGVSRSWVGLILVATVTSLPELITGVAGVTIADTPDIAVGGALGSCTFNLAMLIIADVMMRGEPMYHRTDPGHILSAGFGVILIGFAGTVLIVSRGDLSFRWLHVSAYTPIIVLLYLVAIRAAFLYERRSKPVLPGAGAGERISLTAAIAWYAAAAIVVVLAGAWLPFVGESLAQVMGWHTSFVGTLFVAGVTSLPELAVTISALRIRAVDLVVANLLGSNLFNILVVAIEDIAYFGGPLLASVSPVHAVTAFAAVVMTGILIVAFVFRPETRVLGTFGWASLALLLIYLLSSYAVYLHGH